VAFTYDPATPLGRVRLIITDTDETNPIFQDPELEAFLALNDQDVRLAAADALDAIASNEALVQKRIKLLDLSTDGPAVAKELREHAKRLRDAVDSEVAVDFAEMAHDEFAQREIIWKDALRNA
jgi:hypothetical protein